MPRAWYFSEKAQVAVKRFAGFFAALLVFWMVSRIPLIAGALHRISGGMYAVANTVAQMTSRVFANDDSTMHRLNACVETLVDQVARNTRLASAEDEVAQWRQLFAYERTSENLQKVAARVIARGVLASSDIIIDRGERDGIRIGNAVVIGEGYLLGTIIRVQETQATVRLIEDPQSAITATILGQEKTLGLVVGNEGAVLSLQYVPQDATIAIGDSVVTSGLGGNIPEGLLIGIVETVTTEESAPFVTATVTPIHDPRAWNVVLVIQHIVPEL